MTGGWCAPGLQKKGNKLNGYCMKRVLVINDEGDTNFLIEQALKSKGYEIENARGLQEGRKLFADHEPDLLFLDINLPDGNGMDNISYFKHMKPSTMICMISANDDVSHSVDRDADAFLSKPFSMIQIIEKVKDLIG
jgi:DNA-binding response OmpR family regulator